VFILQISFFQRARQQTQGADAALGSALGVRLANALQVLKSELGIPDFGGIKPEEGRIRFWRRVSHWDFISTLSLI
jgi:hypothetical protein